jgi:hypothetical protein
LLLTPACHPGRTGKGFAEAIGAFLGKVLGRLGHEVSLVVKQVVTAPGGIVDKEQQFPARRRFLAADWPRWPPDGLSIEFFGNGASLEKMGTAAGNAA